MAYDDFSFPIFLLEDENETKVIKQVLTLAALVRKNYFHVLVLFGGRLVQLIHTLKNGSSKHPRSLVKCGGAHVITQEVETPGFIPTRVT